MTLRLHCYSFHSVKGGVGKSTLSTLLAHGLSRRMPTTLIDMDLTGTSLGDVLPLCAPRWHGTMDLRTPPDHEFFSRDETRKRIDQRREQVDIDPVEPPFLNDFLLAPIPRDGEADIHIAALGWRMDGEAEALRVIPSSALPRDLERLLPVIYHEEWASFIEARLEDLLDGLARAAPGSEHAVIFDTPPTIPGLSRTVLSLALRLGRPGQEKQPLAAEEPIIPEALRAAEVSWTIYLVVTRDMQDLRAADRWLALATPEEMTQFRVVINRTPPVEDAQVRAELERKLGGPNLVRAPALDSEGASELPLALLQAELIPIVERTGMQFFSEEGRPSDDLEEVVNKLCGIAEPVLAPPMRFG